jgi:anti-sigma factor RsiW
MSQQRSTDELLVAWLDNELSPAERAEVELRLGHDSYLIERLALLERSSLPFKKSFEPLLAEAPLEELKKHLHAPTSPTVSRRRLIAAAVSFLALGVIGDRAFLRFSEPDENWRGLVAQYMALYTPETLAETPTAQALEAQLRATGTQLDIPLEGAKLLLPNAALKNARVLAYDEQKIAQITWLEARHGPLALCITRHAGGAMQSRSEQRLGMNIVYWSSASHRFMVIGHNPAGQMKALAARLKQAVGA